MLGQYAVRNEANVHGLFWRNSLHGRHNCVLWVITYACEDHSDIPTPPTARTKGGAAETVGLASQHREAGVSRLFDRARSEAWPKLEVVHLTQRAWCCISFHKCGQWLQGRKLVCFADAQKVEGSF